MHFYHHYLSCVISLIECIYKNWLFTPKGIDFFIFKNVRVRNNPIFKINFITNV